MLIMSESHTSPNTFCNFSTLYTEPSTRDTYTCCVCVHSPAMFEGPSGSGEVSQKQSDDGSSSEEEPGLGFFQPAESDDSDTEVR